MCLQKREPRSACLSCSILQLPSPILLRATSMSCCAVQNFLCSNKSDFHCMQKIQCGQRMSKANGGYQRRTIRKIHIHLYPEYLSVSPRFEHQSRSQDRTSRFVTCLRFVASLLASVEPIPAPSDSRLIFNQPSVENSLGPTN